MIPTRYASFRSHVPVKPSVSPHRSELITDQAGVVLLCPTVYVRCAPWPVRGVEMAVLYTRVVVCCLVVVAGARCVVEWGARTSVLARCAMLLVPRRERRMTLASNLISKKPTHSIFHDEIFPFLQVLPKSHDDARASSLT
jgi:hypothetical protein